MKRSLRYLNDEYNYDNISRQAIEFYSERERIGNEIMLLIEKFRLEHCSQEEFSKELNQQKPNKTGTQLNNVLNSIKDFFLLTE